jgi:diamine N-acetyltransferase
MPDMPPVSLREITSDNLDLVLRLSVTEEQEKVYPRSNAYSIAEAHVANDASWIRAVYAGETPVGFLMTSEAPEKGEYFLWRLMVDARHQGKGYGRRAVELLIERIANLQNAKVLWASHLKEDGDAGGFYRKLGFEYTGETIQGGDLLMAMDFSDARTG